MLKIETDYNYYKAFCLSNIFKFGSLNVCMQCKFKGDDKCINTDIRNVVRTLDEFVDNCYKKEGHE